MALSRLFALYICHVDPPLGKHSWWALGAHRAPIRGPHRDPPWGGSHWGTMGPPHNAPPWGVAYGPMRPIEPHHTEPMWGPFEPIGVLWAHGPIWVHGPRWVLYMFSKRRVQVGCRCDNKRESAIFVKNAWTQYFRTFKTNPIHLIY
jgi:hypothetical protein